MATTLYRCRTPTNYFCPCGRVARRLRYAGIDHEEVRVRVLKRDRPEIEAITGQRWVPVLLHGDEVIHDSKRIIQYVEALGRERARAAKADDPAPATPGDAAEAEAPGAPVPKSGATSGAARREEA